MSKTIVVVDDSQTVRQQVGTTLVRGGFRIVEATDGREGLDAILSTADVAAVICDVNMPNMNGLELLEALSKEAANTLPVLMLTTEGRPELVERAKKAGAKGWIVKPFKPELLLAAVKKITGSV